MLGTTSYKVTTKGFIVEPHSFPYSISFPHLELWGGSAIPWERGPGCVELTMGWFNIRWKMKKPHKCFRSLCSCIPPSDQSCFQLGWQQGAALGSSWARLCSAGPELGDGGRTGRRHPGALAALVRAKPLHLLLVPEMIYSLSSSFLMLHDVTVEDSLVEAATVIFKSSLLVVGVWNSSCITEQTAAFWRVGFSLHPIILYSLKTHNFSMCCFLLLPLPALGFCAGWCLKLKELLCLRHPISAIGVTAEIAEKSEEQVLSVHRKQFWALLLC